MKHTVEVQRHPNPNPFSHVVVCTCGHQSLSSNEELAEIHAANHAHVHRLEERRQRV